ncbi:M42 family peptidase [Ktedonosporobacter rubrisoli]|uniref:M42 family peptidase n=1 Tax=Ktedonosporobacter rubrisoli TaxID=2509675 RepID=A0A4P6JHZ8_KTERU|nr:M42 family metallopeptidase [Ktedonosporobacter rubrisoli]QBD74573.1 M42 family peptidase [Ktedonosporobacter rubrisoli]
MAINVELLKKIAETPGIAGREDQVRALILEELRTLTDEVRVDRLGNIIALKRGKSERRVMLAAHMDEIGFIVKHIDDQGFIRIQPVGGFDARVLFAQRVLVHGFAGQTLRGVLMPSSKPIHLLGDEKPPAVKLDDLFIDLGLSKEQVRAKVEVGDMITMDRTLEVVGDMVVSKSLDDRASLFVMLEALRALRSHEVTIFAVATVQEEVGLRGAATAAYQVQPDVSVALDATLAGDIPGGHDQDAVTRLGEGTALKVFDSSHISNHKLVRHFRDVAKQNNIPYQLEVLPRGGTDAGSMQRAREGSPTITLSTPTRYVHTVNEMIHRADLEASINLLARYLEDAHNGDYSF